MGALKGEKQLSTQVCYSFLYNPFLLSYPHLKETHQDDKNPLEKGEEVENKRVDRVQALPENPPVLQGSNEVCGREYLRLFIVRHLLFPRVCVNISRV